MSDVSSSSNRQAFIKELRDWVDIVFKIVLAGAGIVVGYYFSFQKQQNDDIKLIVDMATDPAASKRTMSGPIAKAYFDQKRIPQDVYVAIFSYVNTVKDDLSQRTAFNTAITASVEANPSLAQAVEKATTDLPARVYFQILQESDRAPAADIQKRLAAATLPGGQTLIVPGIERIDHGEVPKTILKCFKKRECETAGKQLVDVLKGYGLAVALSDQSRTYENASTIKPQTFELWFAKGLPPA